MDDIKFFGKVGYWEKVGDHFQIGINVRVAENDMLTLNRLNQLSQIDFKKEYIFIIKDG